MNTTTTTQIRTADLADELAAGMSFPMRNALVPITRASAVALFVARREFWMAAAAGYAKHGTDAEFDVRDALAQAERYAPA